MIFIRAKNSNLNPLTVTSKSHEQKLYVYETEFRPQKREFGTLGKMFESHTKIIKDP